MENFNLPNNNPLLLSRIGYNAIGGLIQFAGLNGLKIINAQNNPYVVPQGNSGDVPPQKFISKLGTVIYSNLIFNAGKVIEGVVVIPGSEWEAFQCDDILFSISQSKKIITTEIQGSDGTVKEYIGLDDFQIQMTGRISGAYNVYEKELVAQLKKILSVGQPLAVSSWYLQNLGITKIVIKDFSFGQTEGEYSTQYFTINALSDNVIEATITQK